MLEASEKLGIESNNGLVQLSLTNTARNNALDQELVDALAKAIQNIDIRETSVVLLTAEGKNFCVGGDAGVLLAAEDRGDTVEQLARQLHNAIDTLAQLALPTVVAVQGIVAGAGLSLAASGDIVLAARSATFSVAYTGIGFSPDGGATYFLPRTIGLRKTQELTYLNRKIDAAEAVAIGLVTRVVDDEVLQEEAKAVARRLAQGPTNAYRAIKKLLQHSYSNALDQQLAEEIEAIKATARSEDGAEGLRAFADRRTPKFSGD